MMTRLSGPYRYILYRVNAFSREIDAEPMRNNSSASIAEVLADMLERASMKPQTLCTAKGHEFTGCCGARASCTNRIGHGTEGTCPS